MIKNLTECGAMGYSIYPGNVKCEAPLGYSFLYNIFGALPVSSLNTFGILRLWR